VRTKQVGHTQGLSSGAPVRQGLQVYWPEPTGWPERPLKPGITPGLPSCRALAGQLHRGAMSSAFAMASALGKATSHGCTPQPAALRTRLLPAHGCPCARGCSPHTACPQHRTRQPREDNVARPVPRHVLGSLRRLEPIWRHYRVQAWGFQANARNRRISGNSSGSMP